MKHVDMKAGSDFKLVRGRGKSMFEVWAYTGVNSRECVWGTKNFVPFTDERKARRFLMKCRKSEAIYMSVYYAPRAN